MVLDLREVIGVSGLRALFDYSPDLSRLTDDQYIGVANTHAKGYVGNEAGALKLECFLTADISAVCSKCLKEFVYPLEAQITARLSNSEEAMEDSELYYIGDARLDADDLIVTELLMRLDLFPVCSPDCKGLCPKCGTDLNESECECKPEIDPRLKKLASLLQL